jgi:hypothetical protein
LFGLAFFVYRLTFSVWRFGRNLPKTAFKHVVPPKGNFLPGKIKNTEGLLVDFTASLKAF